MKNETSRLALASLLICLLFVISGIDPLLAQDDTDFLRNLQLAAVESNQADWGYWGSRQDQFSSWTNHSNRLTPVYTFGVSMSQFTGQNSVYRSETELKRIYGRIPESTLDPRAAYLDQTDIYRLQKQALEQGKRFIVLLIFDGMDWETTRAAAIYRSQAVTYQKGRGRGLVFQDYDKVETDFAWMVTSPFDDSTNYDVNGQVILGRGEQPFGGYNPKLGGFLPWDIPNSYPYLMSQDRTSTHAITDSASSGTSMTCGIKTYNGAVNVDPEGNPVEPLARQLQNDGFAIGVVTSVPVSHATPACAYANNVTRNDYQDLTRDLLGLPSIANRRKLPGVDVLIGCGWGENVLAQDDVNLARVSQGTNFVPGNRYVARTDWVDIDHQKQGQYHVVTRQSGMAGSEVLQQASAHAVKHNVRLFGFFGTTGGHLPYQTANGDFRPTRGVSQMDAYSKADIDENPTLAQMTDAALTVLESNRRGFWLMIEAGDVDWANHNNNIDDSIGAVFSGDEAFEVVCRWAEKNDCWDETAVIVTADHGHLFVLVDPESLVDHRAESSRVTRGKSSK